MARLSKPVDRHDHVSGPAEAAVTLVEYGDFQCPYCGAAYPVIQQICRHLGDRLRFVYRHFPLTEIHPYAEQAAEASECAGEQGEFWEMHDYLFTHQDELNPQRLPDFAEAIGLNSNAFIEDLEDHRYVDKVREDFLSGVRSGVNGTPTLFINGARYDGDLTYADLLEKLERVEKQILP